MHPAFAPAARALDLLDGIAGAVARDVSGEVLFAVRADETFPAASVIKVPLVLALLCDADEGRLSLDERVAVGDRVDGSGVLRDLRDVAPMTLRDLGALALTVSDNTATNLLIERIGKARVNERLDEWGCRASRLRRAMYEPTAGDNLMTAAETTALLARVVRGEGVPLAAAEAMLALLERCQDGSMLERELPEGTRLAHKTGSLAGSRNDAGILLGDRPIVVAGFVRGLANPPAGSAWLALLGWCALRASGRDDLPPIPAHSRSGG